MKPLLTPVADCDHPLENRTIIHPSIGSAFQPAFMPDVACLKCGLTAPVVAPRAPLLR